MLTNLVQMLEPVEPEVLVVLVAPRQLSGDPVALSPKIVRSRTKKNAIRITIA